MVQGQLGEGMKSKSLVTVEEICDVLEHQILPIIPHQATMATKARIVKTVAGCLHKMR